MKYKQTKQMNGNERMKSSFVFNAINGISFLVHTADIVKWKAFNQKNEKKNIINSIIISDTANKMLIE